MVYLMREIGNINKIDMSARLEHTLVIILFKSRGLTRSAFAERKIGLQG
jgi:hypothetical protein